VIAILRQRLAQAASKKLIRDTATMSLGHAFRLGLQALYFIVIARTLGPRQYGCFVAITAVVGIVTPFVGIGGASTLLKNVSRDRSLLKIYWGNGIVLVCASGMLCAAIIGAIGPYLVGKEMRVAIVCFAISELILGRIVELASFARNAIGHMRATALLNVYSGLSRLICVALLSSIKAHPSVQDWCIAILYGSIGCTIYGVYSVSRIAGISFSIRHIKKDLGEGVYFAVGSSAATFYNDIDKTMLARMTDLSATGIYGAAYRLIDVAMAPIKAMTASAYAEFFRRGRDGPQATSRYAYKLIKRASLFGAGIFVGSLMAAPLLPLILGKSFGNSVEALRWLAVLPLIRCGHFFLGDALSGAGLNATRTIIQIVVAITNVMLNLYFIHYWSWRGAAWTSIMCDGLLVVGFGLALAFAEGQCRAAEKLGKGVLQTPQES
jgi:O-antigen/teichoic acid export membrane protein